MDFRFLCIILVAFVLKAKGNPLWDNEEMNSKREISDDEEIIGDLKIPYIPLIENIPPGWNGNEVIIEKDLIINKEDILQDYEEHSLNDYKRSAVSSKENLWLNSAKNAGDIPVYIPHLGKLKSLELDMPDFNELWSHWPCQRSIQELIDDIGGELANVSQNSIHESTLQLSWMLNQLPGHEIIEDYGLSSTKGMNGSKYFYTYDIMRYLYNRYSEPVTGQQLSDFAGYQGIMIRSYQTATSSSPSYEVFLMDQNVLSCGKTLSNMLLNVNYTMWVGGDMEYVANLRNPSLDVLPLADAIAHYHEKTCIRFRPVNDNDSHYLSILKGSRPGICSSKIGKTLSTTVPYQILYLGKGCWLTRIIIHELLHTVGFTHEHVRADRDQYLKIEWQNIPERLRSRFKVNNLGRNLRVPYDYLSIVHYSQAAYGQGRVTMTAADPHYQNIMGRANWLSHKDICRVQRLYCYGQQDDHTTCECTDSDSRCVKEWGAPRGRCHSRQHIDEMALKCPNTCKFCCALKGVSQCKIMFQKVGCWRSDKTLLQEHLFSDREKSSLPSGHKVDWKNWDSYMSDLACRCAKAAAKKKYRVFGLQFYGECWAGLNKSVGNNSNNCWSNGFKKCDPADLRCCVGGENRVFAYRIATFINITSPSWNQEEFPWKEE